MNKEQFEDFVHRLNTQDCRMTSYPIWEVRNRERMYGVDPDYHSSGYIWVDQGNPENSHGTDEELRKSFEEDLIEVTFDEYDDEVIVEETEEHCSAHFKKVHYAIIEVTKCVHFTEKAADDYIRNNRHNLKEPFTYVNSQYRCHEWIDIIDMLKQGQLVLKEEP
jgi:hypothetical protein